MPARPSYYGRPGGFLYVYVVAAVMGLFGRNATYVYLLHGVLLGLSLVVLDCAFARRLSPGGRLAHVALAAGFLYLDLFRHYTHRLLSENLAVFLLPVALGLVLRAGERPSAARGLAAGLALGAVVLTRPNLLLLAPAVVLLLVAHHGLGGPVLRASAALLAGAVGAVSLMVLRNYLVTGVLGAAVFTDTSHWLHPTPGDGGLVARVRSAVTHYGGRLLFMLGWLPVLNPAYRIRPHWLATWPAWACSWSPPGGGRSRSGNPSSW